MPSNEEIGRRVREARESKGMSQGKLGELMSRKRTHAAISDVERGKTALQLAELHEVARILEKEPEYFLNSQPSAAINYLRHNSSLSPEQRKATLDSVEAFKNLVRGKVKTEKNE